jgi:hypothetical protein
VKIDACLRDAIANLDMSSWSVRFGATALVIVLLENIWNAEAKEPGRMERYLCRLECGHEENDEFDDDLRDIDYAISALYRTYGFRNFKRLGISNHLSNSTSDYAEVTH